MVERVVGNIDEIIMGRVFYFLKYFEVIVLFNFYIGNLGFIVLIL